MSVQTEIQAILAPLATGGAWNLRAPQMPVFPYIVWQRISDQPDVTLGHGVAIRNARIQVDAYASTYPAAQAINEAVEAALLASATFKAVPGLCQDLYEDDPALYRISQDFSVWA